MTKKEKEQMMSNIKYLQDLGYSSADIKKPGQKILETIKTQSEKSNDTVDNYYQKKNNNNDYVLSEPFNSEPHDHDEKNEPQLTQQDIKIKSKKLKEVVDDIVVTSEDNQRRELVLNNDYDNNYQDKVLNLGNSEMEEEEKMEEEEEENDSFFDDYNEKYFNEHDVGSSSKYRNINNQKSFKKSSNNLYKYDEYVIDQIKENRLKEIIGYLKVQKQPFDENDLSNIFDRLDVDGDKRISVDELKKFLFSLRTPVNDFYVHKLLKEFNDNDGGEIDKKKFYEKMNEQTDKINENDLTELLEVFKLFDANHDDRICHQDLLNVMMALGENFSASQCKEIINLLCGDSNSSQNQSLDFPTFFELIKNEGEKGN